MLKIDIWHEAEDFIETLVAKHQRQIGAKIVALAENPTPQRSKTLEGFPLLRRIPSGNYRIVYFISGSVLNIVLIGKRGDDEVYRRLKRLFG